MSKIKTDVCRVIIEDFEREIRSRVKESSVPSKYAMDFRNLIKENVERPVVQVPTELLRFRKENGRISSDVLSHEKLNKPIREDDDEDQKILKKFLLDKDTEKTSDLCKSIKHSKQKVPAIITSDGFLINGNRRKLALELLYEETKDARFEWMNVVILPGSDGDETGGSPTVKEIAQIENRYQSQVTGEADYYSFDEAISTRRYIDQGMTLEEKLRDDPRYIDMSPKKFERELKKFEEDYLKPLECVDDYLEYLGRSGLYTNISSGRGDREGRWEAFKDYYKKIRKNITDDNKRQKINIQEDEVGDVESVAFKLIRMRELPGIKLHESMRELPKWLSDDKSKKEILEIIKVHDDIPEEEKYYDDGTEIDDVDKDRIWSERSKQFITMQVKKARHVFDLAKEQDTPLELLDAALKKLEHKNLLPQNIKVDDAEDAIKILNKIDTASKHLKHTFWEISKGPEKLKEKFNKG